MANVPEEGPNSGSSGYDSSLSCPPITSSFRVLMLGDTKVGKSSIMRRYVDDDFDFNFRSVHDIGDISILIKRYQQILAYNFFSSTIGIDYKRKMVRIPECGCEIKLQIWDTAGQERYCHYTLSSLL